ncbi:hypothetical protein JZ751_009761 [Albula glossodonta]|uniref:Uncharacterized protein n=1 Tax=Albula glossodonta TaxID=121402 RepID=A0A8T2P0E6_9TELE|nr:hypothetical protein JZ751_009761 [Albula glossodonta]
MAVIDTSSFSPGRVFPALTVILCKGAVIAERLTGYSWRTTEWSECRVDTLLSQQDRRRGNQTGLCGGGVQNREVYCVQENAELLSYLNNLKDKEVIPDRGDEGNQSCREILPYRRETGSGRPGGNLRRLLRESLWTHMATSNAMHKHEGAAWRRAASRETIGGDDDNRMSHVGSWNDRWLFCLTTADRFNPTLHPFLGVVPWRRREKC